MDNRDQLSSIMLNMGFSYLNVNYREISCLHVEYGDICLRVGYRDQLLMFLFIESAVYILVIKIRCLCVEYTDLYF